MEVEQQPVDPTGGAAAAGNGGAAGGAPPAFDAFLQTGRTGRRNALPDILEEGATNVSTASLPCSFQKLSCSDPSSSAGSGDSSAGKSSTSDGPPKS
ncbi:uncharacterized protein LOC144153913 [Haemaphysalis longicornis]|uniref:Uncharacterized protein n=1 Tax=Haemaphysalis longicornis TaxID=44386 RepID=A0A9J6H9B7_HAELO|nr:hypothetical protein HPB48_025440 [Haemaphysalis longicornis]